MSPSLMTPNSSSIPERQETTEQTDAQPPSSLTSPLTPPAMSNTYSLDLAAELPDLLEQLFLQIGPPLEKFTFFPKLPLEIRLMIWHLTFPRGRNIKLDLRDKDMHIGKLCGGGVSQEAHEIELRCPLPVSLYVNQESRNEALKYYCVLIRPRSKYTVRNYRPFCFNPTLDTGSIASNFLFRALIYPSLHLREKLQIPTSVISLEIRDWKWTRGTRARLSYTTQKHSKPRQSILETLLPLPDLREVTIVLNRSNGEHDIPRLYNAFLPPYPAGPNAMDGKQQIVDEVTKALEALKVESSWKHGVPKVYVKSWSKMKA